MPEFYTEFPLLRDAAGLVREWRMVPYGDIRFDIFRSGAPTEHRVMTFTPEQARSVVAAADGKEIPMDIAHELYRAAQSEGNTEAAQAALSGERFLVGWVRFEVRQDGLYGVMRYTDAGERVMASGQYRWYSPVFRGDVFTHVDAITSVSLTNTPLMDRDQLVALAASAEPPRKESAMDQNELLKVVCTILGIALSGDPPANLPQMLAQKWDEIKDKLVETAEEATPACQVMAAAADDLNVRELLGLPADATTESVKLALCQLQARAAEGDAAALQARTLAASADEQKRSELLGRIKAKVPAYTFAQVQGESIEFLGKLAASLSDMRPAVPASAESPATLAPVQIPVQIGEQEARIARSCGYTAEQYAARRQRAADMIARSRSLGPYDRTP